MYIEDRRIGKVCEQICTSIVMDLICDESNLHLAPRKQQSDLPTITCQLISCITSFCLSATDLKAEAEE